MTSSDVEIAIDGKVAILSLNRPQKRNAIRDQTIETLGHFFAHLPQVGAVLLRANGDDFSAGLGSWGC